MKRWTPFLRRWRGPSRRDVHSKGPVGDGDAPCEALIGRRDIKVQVVASDPGKKIHEILISEEEANHSVARGKYYAILPMLPELRDPKGQEPNALNKEFSSGDVVLVFRKPWNCSRDTS